MLLLLSYYTDGFYRPCIVKVRVTETRLGTTYDRIIRLTLDVIDVGLPCP